MADQRVIPAGFYVYTHARPDGSIFYVGKGSGRRAWDFSPRRRTRHHRNIALKHGLKNILVTLRLCESEEAAFTLEREMILELRIAGDVDLINLTDGGEGASGRPMPESVRAAFARARGPEAFARMPDAAKQRILEGLARGRANADPNWRKTPEGAERLRLGMEKAKLKRAANPPLERTCTRCSVGYFSKSPRALYCAPCRPLVIKEQMAVWRAAQPHEAKPLGPRSPEGRAAISAAQRRRYDAMTPEQREAWRLGMVSGKLKKQEVDGGT